VVSSELVVEARVAEPARMGSGVGVKAIADSDAMRLYRKYAEAQKRKEKP
jgi:hypothetical protein